MESSSYRIVSLADLRKAEKPPAGFQAVGKKGGYKKMIGGKWIYWYPGQPHPQIAQKAPQKPASTKKPSKPVPGREHVSGAELGAPLPVFAASRAQEGTALWKMENGAFRWKKARRFQRSQDDHQMRKTELIPAVDDETKLALLSEFRPLLVSEAKRARRLFALKDRYAVADTGYASNETQEEMAHAAMEGLLQAIDSYKGDAPFAFHAKVYVRDYAALHAAREFMGGVELPERHARNLGRYIAARARASKELGKHNVTPREVVPYFDLRKKHVHADLPAFDEKGAEVRNAQLPEFEGYELGLGRKGSESYVKRKDGTKVQLTPMRDVVKQRSKLEWAEMYHSFLEGQKGVSPIDEETLFPGAGVGLGLSPEDQVVLRNQVSSAMNQLSAMGPSTVEHQLAGTKNPAQFRIHDMGDLLLRRLGVGHEEHSVNQLAQEVPVYKIENGSEKQVGVRNANELMQIFVEKGMQQLSDTVSNRRAKELVDRAKEVIAPTEKIQSGPTYGEMLKEEGAKFSQADVEKWRRTVAAKWKDSKPHLVARVERMSEDEVRIELAKKSRRAVATTDEMHKLMTHTIEVERIGEYEGIMYMRDPSSLKTTAVRVQMNRQRYFSLKKSFSYLTDGMVKQAVRFPKLMGLLLGDDHVPSAGRYFAQAQCGWY